MLPTSHLRNNMRPVSSLPTGVQRGVQLVMHSSFDQAVSLSTKRQQDFSISPPLPSITSYCPPTITHSRSNSYILGRTRLYLASKMVFLFHGGGFLAATQGGSDTILISLTRTYPTLLASLIPGRFRQHDPPERDPSRYVPSAASELRGRDSALSISEVGTRRRHTKENRAPCSRRCAAKYLWSSAISSGPSLDLSGQ